MNAFEYANPGSLGEAVDLLAKSWGETEVMAGGTDLVTSLKQGLTSPRLVVSLSKISDLKGITNAGGSLHIGATTTLSELIADSDVQKNFPALVTAATNIASTQILNMGTVGGDLLQRPRCWYYRNGLGLFGVKDGDSLVADGDNRYHAIFGNSGLAKFVNASSLAPGLIALDASLWVVGPKGKREVKASEFFSTPKRPNEREYEMKANEVLTSISVPMNGVKNATYEVRHRQGLDWPMVTASVAFKGGDASVVLGHVAPVPWHSAKASKALGAGDSADAVAMAAVDGATPLSRNGYKVQQAKVAVKRAIAAANA